jgi:hypothetical protein
MACLDVKVDGDKITIESTLIATSSAARHLTAARGRIGLQFREVPSPSATSVSPLGLSQCSTVDLAG